MIVNPKAVLGLLVAWLTYDAAFHHQAFTTGNRQWTKINQSLYFICYTGVACTGMCCKLCLSLSHPTSECTLIYDPDPDILSCLKTLELAVLAFISQVPPQYTTQSSGYKSPNVWNAGQCCLPQCHSTHACRVCGGPNPAVIMPWASAPPLTCNC